MPQVGKKKFPYTEKGKKAARKEAAKAALGSGERFASLSKKVGSPALAAWIGRKKYGAEKFAKMSAAGRRRG